MKPAQKSAKKSAQSTTANSKNAKAFSDEEQAAQPTSFPQTSSNAWISQ